MSQWATRQSTNNNNNKQKAAFSDHRSKLNKENVSSSLSSSRASSIENISNISKASSYSNTKLNSCQKFESKGESEDYDYCKEFSKRSQRDENTLKSRNNSQEKGLVNQSPAKRCNRDESRPTCDLASESPKKRLRMPNLIETRSRSPRAAAAASSSSSSSQHARISTSLCLENKEKKSFASTPKSERRLNPMSRLKQLKDSEEIQRNLSTSWADIIEELETQTKELNEYTEKVASKYELNKEKLLKSVEQDTEVLRKRQKQINYGKLTAEYQKYLCEVPKTKREKFHPRTPNKFRKCSRRKFDGLVKKWRKLLHVWDENPDQLKDLKFSIDENEENDEFGGASAIEHSSILYNVDDYDIIDYETQI